MTNLPVGQHIVRYGIAADQEYISGDFLDTYDQLVINANMVAHMPGGLASFFLKNARDKPFFIDPQTHLFQFDIGNLYSSSSKKDKKGRPLLKRSIKRLIERYGGPLQNVVADKHESILPQDFTDQEGMTQAFCEGVLKFQREEIAEAAQKKDSAKYIKYAADKNGAMPSNWTPSLLVAPYFYMTSSTRKKWLKANIDCAKYSIEFAGDIPLAVQIVTSRDIFTDEDYRKKILDAYSQLNPRVFLLWIDQFSEHDSPETYLTEYIKLIAQLGKVAPVVNLYGGFFSIALMRCRITESLAGVAHGIGYGEDRGVLPVSGGIPWAKFYFPSLHKRLLFRDAIRAAHALDGLINADNYYEKVCNCEECLSVIGDNPVIDFEEYGKTKPVVVKRTLTPIVIDFPLPETKRHCTRHFMLTKKREHEDAITRDSLLAELAEGKLLERTLGLDSVSHCSVWENVLSSLC